MKIHVTIIRCKGTFSSYIQLYKLNECKPTINGEKSVQESGSSTCVLWFSGIIITYLLVEVIAIASPCTYMLSPVLSACTANSLVVCNFKYYVNPKNIYLKRNLLSFENFSPQNILAIQYSLPINGTYNNMCRSLCDYLCTNFTAIIYIGSCT